MRRSRAPPLQQFQPGQQQLSRCPWDSSGQERLWAGHGLPLLPPLGLCSLVLGTVPCCCCLSLGTILALSCFPTGRFASAHLPLVRVLGTSCLPTGMVLAHLPIWNLLGLSHLSFGTAPGISSLHSPAALSHHLPTGTLPGHLLVSQSHFLPIHAGLGISHCLPTRTAPELLLFLPVGTIFGVSHHFTGKTLGLSHVPVIGTALRFSSPWGNFSGSHNFFLLIFSHTVISSH